MSAGPARLSERFKVYDVEGELRGLVRYAEDAAALRDAIGKGAYLKPINHGGLVDVGEESIQFRERNDLYRGRS